MDIINNMIFDSASIALLLFSIDSIYKKRYAKTANYYIKNQLAVFISCCISMLILYIYYYLENWLHIDDLYLNGIGLIIFFLISGIGSNIFYIHCFKSKKSKYEPTSDEYLFLIITSFIGTSIRMVFYGIVNIATPVALILGRLIWLDTRNFRSIIDAFQKVKHKRIVESSILYLLGTFLVSCCIYCLKLENIWKLWLSIVYGLIILYPYNIIQTKRIKKKL